jgi:hypothetical protein
MPKIHSHEVQIKWLIDPVKEKPGSTIPASSILERLDFPLPPEIGHGWLERMPVAHGMTVSRGLHFFRPEAAGHLIPLGEFEVDFPETTLMAQTVQGSEICHREFHPPAELILRPGLDCFRHADRIHVIPLINSSSNSIMSGMSITDTALAELMGQDLAQQLIARLGLDTPPVVKIMTMPLHVSAPLRACLSDALMEPLKKVFAQSKVLEYLCAVAPLVITQPAAPSSSGRRRDRVRELHG